MYQEHLLSASDVDQLAEAAFAILDEVGILCQCDELLDALEAAGARVSRSDSRVSFPRDLVASFAAACRDEHPLPSLTPGPFPAVRPPVLGLQIAQLVYDYPSGERRQGNTADFVEFLKLGEMLHGDRGVGHCLLLADVPPLLEPLRAAVLMAEHVTTPQPAFAWTARQVPYLREMGEILGRREWYSLGAICIAHPFRFDRDVAERLVLRARAGGSIGLTAMPVAGMTTPLSPAGFAATAGAEMMACWLAGRALNPEVPLGGSMWPGSVDMRTGEVSYCTFDSMLLGFTVCEFLRHWAHVRILVGGGEYCDAKEPGYFAAYEKAYKSMTIAAFQGQHPQLGLGMLEDGKTLCAEQLLLERELAVGQGYLAPGPLDLSLLDLEGVLEVGRGEGGTHLDRDLTLTRFRDLGWAPQWFDRSGWRGGPTDRAVLERLHAVARELINSYEPPARDEAQLKAMREVVAQAKRDWGLAG